MIYKMISRSYFTLVVVFVVMLTVSTFAQEYDPYTGELIIPKVDTTAVLQLPVSPIFDPLTGEIISSDPVTPGQATELPVSNNTASICTRAKLDAIKATSELWYVGGIIYFVGVPVYLFSSPDPPTTAVANMNAEDVMLYVKCYKDAVRAERGKRMLTGCGLYIGVVLMLSGF